MFHEESGSDLEMLEKIFGQLKLLTPISSGKADHDYFNSFLKSKADVQRRLSMPLERASILVVGCGYLYPDVLLYSTCSKKVVGIDVKKRFWRDGLVKTALASLKKQRGAKKVIYAVSDTFQSRCLVKKNYYGRFEQYSRRTINHDNLEIISYGGKRMPFEDNTFDVVISNAVLEHVKEISNAIQEMARVTNEGGINYHLYHNYYSFSGNHKPYDLNKKLPWGHLRGLIETNSEHLNKLKIVDLEKIFLSYFKDVEVFSVDRNHCKRGVEDHFTWEEEALFQRYRRELEQKYPSEMLLSRGFLITGKKG